jgi:hypothetical protein
MEGWTGELNNQGPTGAGNKSDLNAFMSGYRSRPPETWWRQNVDLPGYYGYRCVVEGVHHGDIAYGKNWFFYLNPETNRWSMLPWDTDLTWANNMYGNGEDAFKADGRIFNNPAILVEYNNRLREFHDLLYNNDQAYQMLDDLANIIDPPTGGPTFVGADRAMWDYNPIMVSGNVNPGKSGQGRFYQKAPTKDFRGMVKIMKDYVVSNNRAFSTYREDPEAPQTPVVAATGPGEFPLNALTFRTSNFSDPQGAQTFAALKWRIAEVAADARPATTTDGGTSSSSGSVLLPDGASWRYFKGLSEPSATPGAWRLLNFDDSQWLTGRTPIGYDTRENIAVTYLSDMDRNYSTIYLRKTFDVATLAGFSKLILDIKYDDGVIVWLNGSVVFQNNVASTELPYNATATSQIEESNFQRFDLGDPRARLVQGKNIIAVQVLNGVLGGSSDCFVDVRLTAERAQGGGEIQPPVVPVAYRKSPGKYEIEAAWESDELTAFKSDVTIPASVVRPGRTYRVRCKMKDSSGRWSHWSAPVQFTAGEPIAAGVLSDLRVTELMYNPSPSDTLDGDEFEFIELKNTGDQMLDLRGVSFTSGVSFDFELVVKNKPAFESRYGQALSGRIAGQYEGRLANNGENVSLVDFWNGTIVEFEYGDGRGWPVAADGGGHSLVPLDSAVPAEPQGSLNYPGNWRASTYPDGSPGQDDPAPVQTLVINEFMANGGDWIELYNPTASAAPLAGWYLSDDVTKPKKWALPADSVPAKGFKSLGNIDGFGLAWSGEQVVLSYLPGTVQDRIVDAVAFKAQEPDVSLDRYQDGGPYWRRMAPSKGAANGSPVPGLIVSEIMYHPADPNEEYIELYNPTAQPVVLGGGDIVWRLDGAVDYNLPAGAAIPAGGRLVIVGFDPLVETSRLIGFITAYRMTAGAQVLGPWRGNLSNRGERLGLEKSLSGGSPTDRIGWVVVDEIIYSDVAPWPTGPDGHGKALQRIHLDAAHSGNDPANWRAAPPTPGIVP